MTFALFAADKPMKGVLMKSVQRLFIFILIKMLIASSTYAGIESTGVVTGLGKVITLTLPAPYNETVYAGTFAATIGGNATNLYCIDITHQLAFNESYQDVSSTDSVLTYILNNYYPYKAYPYTNSMSTVESEAGAVQLSLWHFSDGLNVNQVTNVDASVIARANAIIADANANAHIFSLNSFAIVIPSQSFNIGSPIQFTVQAFDDMGIAMRNVQITLSTTSGTLSTTTTVTGATGVSPVITLTPAAGQTTASITASGTVGIPAGTKYFHVADPNGKQKLILATPTIASRTISRQITWYNQIQLVVTKTADKTSCNDGDIVNYTIKVKNIGTTQAQNVVVSDQLPAALSFVSCSPSGAFNASSGLWNVGILNVGDSSSLVIKTKVSYANPSANSYSLGTVAPYNLFVIDTLIQPSADTQGKLAVGGYADLQGYSVGDQLPANSGNVLVVGNHLTFVTGRVYNGKAVYQNYITSTQGFSADSGIVKDSVFDFAAAKLYLLNLSQQLATLAKTDTVKYLPNNSVELDGSRSGLNVFYVDGSKLLTTNDISINVPTNATVLVNISGTHSQLFGGFEVNGTTKDKVFLNFYQATTLTFSGIDVKASVLAPNADLTFPAGIVSGQLIVRKMTGSGQVNLSPFTGAISRDTSLTNLATVTGASVSSMPSSYNAGIGIARLSATNGVNGIRNDGTIKVESFKLEQNYPNPFNPTTKLRFNVATSGNVKITVYNITGQEVAILTDGFFAKGSYEVTFDATRLASGVYFARMATGSFSSIQKMILQK
jgi:choice-of-anchor A domain-containing protein/uncharacterized repeat protein (TIGR01451 family)